MKCPKCGYIQPKKLPHRPKKFTAEQEKEIINEYFSLIDSLSSRMEALRKISGNWQCCDATIYNIIKRNKKNG